MTQTARHLACCLLGALTACASITASQTFELATETAAMPGLPQVADNLPDAIANMPQTVTLTAKFGSCSDSALGNLEKVRANSHVDSLDVWVVVRDVELRSDATFSGIQTLNLQLVTADEVISVCNRTLSASEQRASTLGCPFEHRVRAEQLCEMFGSSSAPAQMTIQVKVITGDVTLTTIGAKIQVETEVDADVSL